MYTICGYKAIKTIQLDKNKLRIDYSKKKQIINNPLVKIDELIKKFKFKKHQELPPMAGAFFG